MKERDLAERVDATYPFIKIDESGKVIETLNEPTTYDIKFMYHK